MKRTNDMLDVYQVDENELWREVCNLYLDEDNPKYYERCKCKRCYIPKKFELGGLK